MFGHFLLAIFGNTRVYDFSIRFTWIYYEQKRTIRFSFLYYGRNKSAYNTFTKSRIQSDDHVCQFRERTKRVHFYFLRPERFRRQLNRTGIINTRVVGGIDKIRAKMWNKIISTHEVYSRKHKSYNGTDSRRWYFLFNAVPVSFIFERRAIRVRSSCAYCEMLL